MTRCERKGHKWRYQIRRGYLTECDGIFKSRCVADTITQERHECKRCDLATEWETVDRDCLQGLTIDKPLFEKLRREGELFT